MEAVIKTESPRLTPTLASVTVERKKEKEKEKEGTPFSCSLILVRPGFACLIQNIELLEVE